MTDYWFEVLRRAEQSQKDAKIVVDASRLSRLRNSNFRGTFDESEGMFTVENDSILVQMDSLPESKLARPSLFSLIVLQSSRGHNPAWYL